MPSEPVIVVRSLSKRFALRKHSSGWLRNLFTRKPTNDESGHWALRDVTFELQRGETLGVMGRNGCGKSTLLEIIAGTMTPTNGEVEVRGDLAALLELGAAFSPELTGRENVFVYGSLLGMPRTEIRARFDEIVDFAELGSYIDEPVKKYSSGMFVRLAFSTAIAATPEILVIDEALAVGDEAFQRRCYARIESLKRSGVSMLFVSHAAGTMLELCDRILLLDRGEPLLLGRPRDVIRHYHRLIYAAPEDQEEIRRAIVQAADPQDSGSEAQKRSDDSTRPSSGASRVDGLEAEGFEASLQSKSRLEYASRGARIQDPTIQKSDGAVVNVLRRGERYFVCYRIFFDTDVYGVRPGMLIKNVVGTELGGIVAEPRGEGIEHLPAGTALDVRIPFCVRLVPNTYFANVGVVGLTGDGENHLHRITDALVFRVLREREGRVTGSVDLSTNEPAQIDRRSTGSVSESIPP